MEGKYLNVPGNLRAVDYVEDPLLGPTWTFKDGTGKTVISHKIIMGSTSEVTIRHQEGNSLTMFLGGQSVNPEMIMIHKFGENSKTTVCEYGYNENEGFYYLKSFRTMHDQDTSSLQESAYGEALEELTPDQASLLNDLNDPLATLGAMQDTLAALELSLRMVEPPAITIDAKLSTDLNNEFRINFLENKRAAHSEQFKIDSGNAIDVFVGSEESKEQINICLEEVESGESEIKVQYIVVRKAKPDGTVVARYIPTRIPAGSIDMKLLYEGTSEAGEYVRFAQNLPQPFFIKNLRP